VTTSDTAIAAYGRQTVRAFHISHVAATLCGFVVLLAPALWNRYPLLQYDTGGYLARWYEGYLVPSRSTVFGLFLHLGEGLHFWPELVLQTGCAIWVASLVLRAAGFAVGAWHRTLMVAGLALATALPVLSSSLLTDIFAGLRARLDAGRLRNCLRPHAAGWHRHALSRRPLSNRAAQALSIPQRAAGNRR
jgi:hypothetical protein